MRDQLSLRLEPEIATLPNLPDGPADAAAPGDRALRLRRDLFEPAWGGRRALAFVGPARSRAAVTCESSMRPGGTSARASRSWPGWPSGSTPGRRSSTESWWRSTTPGAPTTRSSTARIAGEPGRAVAFLAFDLLHLDGRSLLTTPLHRRRALLKKVLHPGDEVVAVPAIATEGRALHAAATAQGIAGVLARQRTSPYLSGVTSRLWQLIPVAQPEPGRQPTQATLELEEHPATAAAPVLALISRLPLLFDE